MEEIRFNLFKSIHKGTEAKSMTGYFLSSSTGKSEQAFLQWMLIHNTNRELASWLTGMNQKSTASQFNQVYDLAQKVLAPERLEFINLNVYANEN